MFKTNNSNNLSQPYKLLNSFFYLIIFSINFNKQILLIKLIKNEYNKFYFNLYCSARAAQSIKGHHRPVITLIFNP